MLIPNLVLLETLWVPRSAYRFSRQAIIEAVDRLEGLPGLRFDSRETTREFVRLGKSTSLDLADILIGLHARALGCETTLTFDQHAAKTGLFQDVP